MKDDISSAGRREAITVANAVALQRQGFLQAQWFRIDGHIIRASKLKIKKI